ncbi:MAG TPA: DUF695 domain-containing protein [Phycisphaerae bacterium]|nr:DUF695 domain-containing protein [Phycisphaerae bacterium]
MTTRDPSDKKWDFYMCRVDDAPASIFLDMALLEGLESASEDTLYALHVTINDPGEHGMGTSHEMEVMSSIEDQVIEQCKLIDLQFIGRLRNNSNWQMTFMGPPKRERKLKRIAKSSLKPVKRAFDVMSQRDPEWSYYRNFLYPDAERFRWMKDKWVVQNLIKNGDSLVQSRRVDHWVFFEDESALDKFASAADSLGFGVESSDTVEDRLVLQIHRVDKVDLESIHLVTEQLHRLADDHGGEYDGWETSVEKQK